MKLTLMKDGVPFVVLDNKEDLRFFIKGKHLDNLLVRLGPRTSIWERHSESQTWVIEWAYIDMKTGLPTDTCWKEDV